MPEEKLKEFMKSLQTRFGKEGERATYEGPSQVLGVSTATVGNLMKGRPSKRDVTVEMADNAGLLRTQFLRASGYLPSDRDIENDRELIRQQADKEGKPRIQALHAAGLPHDWEDSAWDQAKFGEAVAPQPLSDSLRPFAIDGDVFPVSDIPLVNSKLPMGENIWADPEFAHRNGIASVYAEGDSMSPTFKDGDLVFFRPFRGTPRRGQAYIIWAKGLGVTCKRLVNFETDEGGETVCIFKGDNPNSKPIRLSREEVFFQGVPVGSIKKAELDAADEIVNEVW
jgi:hypothetical protein